MEQRERERERERWGDRERERQTPRKDQTFPEGRPSLDWETTSRYYI
jgi:hypothetical protein